MDVREGQAFWDQHARRDPLWAILSEPDKTGRRWDLESFLETGRREVSLLMYQLGELGITVDRTAALDFGCGVGRLTQPLGGQFDQVVGVDVSQEMIALARQLNGFPDRVRYVHNTGTRLESFTADTFTFIYSNVVLQHIAPAATLRYLREFFRVLSRDGVLAFQLPSHPRRVQDAPPQSRPMPNAAYRAAIHLENGTLDGAAPGTRVLLTLSVTNLSGESWSQHDVGPLRLGNHWLAGDDSAMLIQDDGRTPLPAEVAAGATCRVQLMVTTPREPGIYVLQCDVAHEGVTWFADRGSRPWSRVVPTGDVPWAQPVAFPEPGTAGHGSERTLGLTAEAPAVDPGPLPMHGIHRAVVEQAVRDFGGRVLHVEVDERCGKEWVGFRYFARKL